MTNAMWMQSVEWLAAAATDPRSCKREWDQGNGGVLLEAGRFWDVVSVPEPLGLLALDILWCEPLRVPGPTLVDVITAPTPLPLPPKLQPEPVGAGAAWRP